MESGNKIYKQTKFMNFCELNDECFGITSRVSNQSVDAGYIKINKNLNLYNAKTYVYDDNTDSKYDNSNNIEKLGFDGYASLIKTNGYGADGYDGLLVTSLKNSINSINCKIIQDVERFDVTITKSNNLAGNFSYTYPALSSNITINEVTPSISNNVKCTEPLCWCDQEFIHVTLEQKEDGDPQHCCYNLKFHKTAQGCNVYRVLLSVEGISESEQFIINFHLVNQEEEYSISNYCVNPFDGVRKLKIQYTDIDGIIICETSMDIYCNCSCSDYEDINNFHVIAEPIIESYYNHCCWQLRLTNDLPCAFFDYGIEMSFPDKENLNDALDELYNNLNLSGLNDWTYTGPTWSSSEQKWKIIWQRPTNPNRKILKTENGEIFGTFCTKGYYWEQAPFNFDFKVIHTQNENCESYITTQDLTCDNNICGNNTPIQITINGYEHTPSVPCNFYITTYYPYFSSLYGIIIRLPNKELPIFTRQHDEAPLDPDGFNTINFDIPDDAITSDNPYKIEIEWIDLSGSILCVKETTLNITNCLNKCCQNTQVTRYLWDNNITFFVDFPSDCGIYSVEVKNLNTNNIILTYPYQYNSEYPWDLMPYEFADTDDMLFIISNDPTYNVSITLYGKNGNVLCTKILNWMDPFYKPSESENNNIPVDQKILKLYNVPNPASDYTNIYYELNNSGYINMDLIDAYGNIVKKLKETYYNGNKGVVSISTSDLISGIYFARIRAGNAYSSIPIIVLH